MAKQPNDDSRNGWPSKTDVSVGVEDAKLNAVTEAWKENVNKHTSKQLRSMERKHEQTNN
jgi:hypothetical protein